ncbi:DUF91 domain-containing protein, partial [Candidatus Woesearchaeota archaeon]|nr:DUF91 domain-containing protein [Candidatus Woesearchaeota archaeon]
MWDPGELAALLNDALKRNETIVLACTCSIRYSGRAESMLGEGDRIIIIKGDKALLVHQPHGNNPINYMKPDTSHGFIVEDGKLRLHSSHT